MYEERVVFQLSPRGSQGRLINTVITASPRTVLIVSGTGRESRDVQWTITNNVQGHYKEQKASSLLTLQHIGDKETLVVAAENRERH